MLLVATLALPFARTAHADAPSEAETEKARLLYNEGLDLRDAGDLKGALLMFQAAFKHVPSPVIGLDLARLHEKLGQLVEALEVTTAIAKIPVGAEETAKSASAREDAAKLEKELPKRIASIKLNVKGGSETVVTIDGVVVPADELGATKKVNPGKHVVVLRTAPDAKQEIDLGEGEAREVSLRPETKTKLVTDPSLVAPTRSTNVLAIAGFSAAGVSLLVGSVTGMVAFQKTSALQQACYADGRCPSGQEDNIHSARTMGTISTISFVASGAFAIVGIVGLVRGTASTPASPTTSGSITPWISVGSIGLSGAF